MKLEIIKKEVLFSKGDTKIICIVIGSDAQVISFQNTGFSDHPYKAELYSLVNRDGSHDGDGKVSFTIDFLIEAQKLAQQAINEMITNP